MDVLANLLIDRRYSDEAGESLSNPRKPTVAKHRGNFAVPVSRPCHVSAMNRAQSVDERLMARRNTWKYHFIRVATTVYMIPRIAMRASSLTEPMFSKMRTMARCVL